MAAEGAVRAVGRDSAREEYVRRNLRRNYVLLLLDAVSFPFGISFVSTVTILPLFVSQLTDSALAVGAISAISSLGTLLPPLFVANRTERRPLQKWYLFWLACVERAPFLLLAALIPWLGRENPGLLLWAFFAGLAVHNVAMGFNMPAYFNLLSKVIPANRRGSMWGVGGAIGGLLALAGAQLSGLLLAAYGFPDAYALSFLLAFVFLTLGIVGFRWVRELPSAESPPPVPTIRALRNAPALLRRDGQFGLFVASQLLHGVAFIAPAFYTASAIARFGADARTVALYTTVLMGTSTVANLGMGFLADRRGNKLVLQLGMGLWALAALLAVVAPSAGWVAVVFALHGIALTGTEIGGFNLPLEFAPRAQVPTYSAVYMTAIAPVRALASLLGGWLAALGYAPVFLLGAITAVVGLALLTASVRDPRRRETAG